MPKLHLDRYQDGFIKYNSLVCRTICGRQLRFNNVINPIRHTVFYLQTNSPLVKMAIAEAHKRIGCGLGTEAYIKSMIVMGISAPNLHVVVRSYIKACQGCLQYNLFFTAKTPFSRAIKEQSGPNDSLDACLNKNPLSFLILDETGPIHYVNSADNASNQYLTVYLLIGIELVTRRVHIVPINNMTMLSVVQGSKYFKTFAVVYSI